MSEVHAIVQVSIEGKSTLPKPRDRMLVKQSIEKI